MADSIGESPPDAVETDDLFDDEGVGEMVSVLGSTESLASAFYSCRQMYGRTYHEFRAGENDYWAPNDEKQNESLDIGHAMFTLLLGNNLFLAPIDQETAHEVLDVGCGTGIWCMDFADAHPQARVEGVDLSPIQPRVVPPNCHFVVDDVEYDWLHPVNYFDFIHIRSLVGAIKNWPRLYRQAYDRLKPGRWIEHVESSMFLTSDDESVSEGHIMRDWSRTLIHSGERTGKTFHVIDRALEWLREVGFEDVQVKWYKVPIGRWMKDTGDKRIGILNYFYCDDAAEGWALYLLINVLGWSLESCRNFIARFRRALKDRRNHAYYHV